MIPNICYETKFDQNAQPVLFKEIKMATKSMTQSEIRDKLNNIVKIYQKEFENTTPPDKDIFPNKEPFQAINLIPAEISINDFILATELGLGIEFDPEQEKIIFKHSVSVDEALKNIAEKLKK